MGFLTLCGVLCALGGCVNVEPFDREYLAKEHMAPDEFTQKVGIEEHAYFSREGTEGALAPDAGGCGCN